jgi:hypothetical protein
MLNIDPNAFPSTNPVINVQAAPRMSNRQFYDAFINADTLEEEDAIIATDKALSTDIFGNPVGIASTKQMDLYGSFGDELDRILYSPYKLFGYDVKGSEYDADVKDDMEFIERVTGYTRQMGGSTFVPVDENAYQSTNPTITVAPNRLSNRDYYEKYLELLTGEEYDGELQTVIDAIVNPQDGTQEVLGKLVQAFDFPEYNYDAANEFYRQDSALAELGAIPEAYDLGDFFKIYGFMGRPRDFSDRRFEALRNFIEMTDDGRIRHVAAPEYQGGGPVYDERGVIEFEPDRDKARGQRTVGDPDDTKIFPDPNEDDVVEETEEDGLSPFGKFSNAAVSVARGMNQIALRKQQREAERLKRMNLSADNLFGVSDPLYERGTFDVNTGIAQSDNLVPYLPMGEMGMEVEADEEMIRKLIAAGAQIKY